MDNRTIRIVGDMPLDEIDQYKKGLEAVDQSLQLGDMGMKEDYAQLEDLNPLFHRFIPGNHDDYDHLPPHALRNGFGMGKFHGENIGGPSGLKFFFIRGAESTDKARRIEGETWWAKEELSQREMYDCYDLYLAIRPPIVFSHDCPTWATTFFPGRMRNVSRTNQFLQRLWECHEPDLWLFGHHHETRIIRRNNAQLACIGEGSFADIDKIEGGDLRVAIHKNYESGSMAELHIPYTRPPG